MFRPVIFFLAYCAATSLAQDNVFPKDPRLTQSFWGMAYSSPGSASYPTCGVDTLDAIVKDIQLLGQVTTHLRTYGSDCNQTSFILDAIQRTQVNVQVYLGVYVDADPATYKRQIGDTLAAIQKFGTTNIAGLTVGNEYILNETNNHTDQATAEATLVAAINDARTQLGALNLGTTIPVGTAEVTAFITSPLVAAADYVMANAHPYFALKPIAEAAIDAQTTLLDDNGTRQLILGAGKTLFMGEVGWPSAGNATASLADEQTFIDTFVCDANTKGVGYFYFELIDASWKIPTDTGVHVPTVDPFWGIFDKDKQLKVTVPTCSLVNSTTPGSSSTGSTSGSPTQSGKAGSSSTTGTPKPTGDATRAYPVTPWLLSLAIALCMLV